ncbi:hypothetical protein GCM10025867_48550 (plasmid) [Frondihabitans sucicola]|uniref:Uncharacterized protein n=1 Tax=Frondihabitans sucicola TaxID=1268041 RepID=A0ABM8GVV8_9MICO|nr:hypothetical protein [Frondihabitans sucicola]BDZ52614.1 hypothetical protein GCM10025867_48550 [Frondihabitans sucicola]
MAAVRLVIHVVFALALLGAGAYIAYLDPAHFYVGILLLGGSAMVIFHAIATTERLRDAEPDRS